MATRKTSSLQALPAELLIKLMKEMRAADLTSFVQTSKFLYYTFQHNPSSIMTSVLLRQPELRSILYIYTTNWRDFRPSRMLYQRTISFDAGRSDGKLIPLVSEPVGWRGGKLVVPCKIVLKLDDLKSVWNMVRVVDWWVEQYPRYKWLKSPVKRRTLRPREEERLRRAMGHWWLFAECFHNRFTRKETMPAMWEEDGRLHHMRRLSTMEVRELDALWDVVEGVVRDEICSTVNDEAELVPWGWDQWRSKRIWHTYMKLDPEQLKDLVEQAPRLDRSAIVCTARSTQEKFEHDQEMLSSSIHIVLQERLMFKQNRVTDISDIPESGILDEEAFPGPEYASDAWSDGKPPLTKQEIMAYPQRARVPAPHGDDGQIWEWKWSEPATRSCHGFTY